MSHRKGKKKHRTILYVASQYGQPSEGYEHRRHRKDRKKTNPQKRIKIEKIKEKDYNEDIEYYGI